VTFNEVLSQTIAMLQQHGRVSYRALKRQFALDDAFLEDLKYELVAVQQRASAVGQCVLTHVDQPGLSRVLVVVDDLKLDQAPGQNRRAGSDSRHHRPDPPRGAPLLPAHLQP